MMTESFGKLVEAAAEARLAHAQTTEDFNRASAARESAFRTVLETAGAVHVAVEELIAGQSTPDPVFVEDK